MAAMKGITNLDPTPDLTQAVIHGIRHGTPASEMVVRLRSFFGLLLNKSRPWKQQRKTRSRRWLQIKLRPRKPRDDAVEAMYRAWESDYYDSPLEDLQSFIVKYSREDYREIYAKTVVFVQSSGMGKSRLAKEYGRRICPMVSYCLRRKGEFASTSYGKDQHMLPSHLAHPLLCWCGLSPANMIFHRHRDWLSTRG
jgi:hypothetical protein